jgi:hypothetical protein
MPTDSQVPGSRSRMACGRYGAHSTCPFPRVGVGELFPGRSVVQGDESQGYESPPNESVRLTSGRADSLPKKKDRVVVGRASISQHYAPFRRPTGTKRGRRKDEVEDGKAGRQKGSRKERTVKERKESFGS